MNTIDIYLQYFAAEAVWNGTPRHGAAVRLSAESGEGMIRYSVSVSFFPHEDEEDFRIPADAYSERELYHAKGRRSRKREAAYLDALRETADALAAELGGVIDWERPLIEARYC
ncbi:MAG: hypothetical protein IJR65_03950 [Oscillospiraceae bacterium]|nr:hypothetical protein [Oscillospiraceae bacterium]